MVNCIWFLILCIVFSICSSTLLWRIETSTPAYIFGTIHIPYGLVWPHVSNETRQAFMSSNHFYAEIDAKNDAYWDDFLQCLVNRSSRIRRSNTLVTEGDLLDVYLAVEARRLNKTVGSLEPAEYMCQREGWRYDLTTWREILHVLKTKMKNKTKYICDEMDSRHIQTLFESYNQIQQTEQRDKQMSKQIHTLLKRSKKNRYFFAVGAAHMLGKHKNLLFRLRKFGYKITRVCTDRNRLRKKSGCKKKKKILKHCTKN